MWVFVTEAEESTEIPSELPAETQSEISISLISSPILNRSHGETLDQGEKTPDFGRAREYQSGEEFQAFDSLSISNDEQPNKSPYSFGSIAPQGP